MKICSIEGCVNKHEAKGYCKSHYRRLLKYGNPLETAIKSSRNNPSKNYEENHKTIDGIGYKLCNDCNEWYPLNEEYFYKNKSSSDGFNPYCKKCSISRQQEKYWNDPILGRQKKKEWRDNNKENHRKMIKSWEEDNKEYLKEKRTEWRQENPDKVKGYNYNHMHKQHNISEEEWQSCKSYFNGKCAYCGIDEQEAKEEQGHSLHMEHAINNGANDLSNCIPSCKSCNSQKWVRDFDEWYAEGNNKYDLARYNKIIKWLGQDYELYIKSNNLII
jgi:hypothetical protein